MRRHGAEEVEHRAVAFAMYQHRGGQGPRRYARRVAGTAVTAPTMLRLRAWGAVRLLRHGAQLAERAHSSLAAHNSAVRKGLLTTGKELGAAVPRCPRRSYHPSQEGPPRGAVAQLARSPAARTGARTAARTAAGALGRTAVS
ncbi:hypothetical protein GFH48_21000 [Streptomyces fagopyri]|uniref:Metal-dependent hydrolase n=1 Tax=Streptomyces fagopyri TaxID=2662397 RepID=A0A5Q0LEC3_9ACTN|nr:metal-dependent hydrolase [Streptomyces fagopyri]QFZ75415.1 hypothetical protein GFH48_21000 [Streptomyces fagopyri]